MLLLLHYCYVSVSIPRFVPTLILPSRASLSPPLYYNMYTRYKGMVPWALELGAAFDYTRASTFCWPAASIRRWSNSNRSGSSSQPFFVLAQ